MENDTDVSDAVAAQLKEELDVAVQHIPPQIVKQLFALSAAEEKRKAE